MREHKIYGARMTKISRFGGFVVALALLAGTQQIVAQELNPAHIKAAKQALAASGATLRFDNILPSVAAKMKTEIIASRPDLADSVTSIIDEETLKLAVRRGDLENESAAIYGRVFAVEELKQISDFYNSVAGKKLIKEAPVLARELNKASQIWGAGIQRDLALAVSKAMKEKGVE
jgi:hypothetical protein